MDTNSDVIIPLPKYIFLRHRVAIFADIIKIITIFIERSFKDSRKLKELELIYQNEIYICIS